MRTFFIIWAGQLVSLLGSGLTGFSLGIWVFETTRSSSFYALALLAVVLPGLVMSPAAGVIADRWDRRKVMLAADVGGGLCSLAAYGLLATGRAEFWNVCALMAVDAACGAIRVPAWTASVSLIVPGEQLGRASGLMESSKGLTQLLSPLLAGVLMTFIHVQGVLLLDTVTFAVAIASLLIVRIPRPAASAEGRAGRGSLFAEALQGLRYVQGRGGLMGLLLVSLTLNFSVALGQVSFAPLVLSHSSAAVLGTLTSACGLGMLAGSVLMGAWGGPRRRVEGVLGFSALLGVSLSLFGFVPVGLHMAAISFGMFLCVPFVTGSSQVIWQRKVVPDLQGRVFALRSMVSLASPPLAYALAGPLVEQLLEPAMAPGGSLAGTFGQVLGVGPGRGTALLFVLAGGLVVAAVVAAYLAPSIRRVEADLPDVGVSPQVAATAATVAPGAP